MKFNLNCIYKTYDSWKKVFSQSFLSCRITFSSIIQQGRDGILVLLRNIRIGMQYTVLYILTTRVETGPVHVLIADRTRASQVSKRK